jgi:hypothetical protein
MLLAPACSCAPIYLLKPGINSLGARPNELKEANMLDVSSGGREEKEMYAVFPGSFLSPDVPLAVNSLIPSTV